MKLGYVYIMSNKYRTTFYIGVTSNLMRRVLEHKIGIGSEFTKEYHLTYLVYQEMVPGIKYAIQREKQLKNWKKKWKIDLIKTTNPNLVDLAADWYDKDELNAG